MTVEQAREFFDAVPVVARKLQTLVDVGLSYITLGQSATTLSGGEAQRVKLALELAKRDTGRTLYILDEPTTGLHFQDIEMLLAVLQRLAANGNTIVVIEHNLDVIKTADWIVDLGPEGGDGGGRIHRRRHAGTGGEVQGQPHRPLPEAATGQEEMSDAAGFKGKKGLTRLWNALGYSRDGIRAAWQNEAAFREEILLAAIALPLAFYLGKNGIERALMIGAVLLILIVEILNSAVEAVVDKASPEKHELAKRAKDMGSAAVLLSLLNAAAIWACLLWP
jgi:diacylglycerol kinase